MGKFCWNSVLIFFDKIYGRCLNSTFKRRKRGGTVWLGFRRNLKNYDFEVKFKSENPDWKK